MKISIRNIPKTLLLIAATPLLACLETHFEPGSYQKLPLELKLNIFSHFDAIDLARVRQVSKYDLDAANESLRVRVKTCIADYSIDFLNINKNFYDPFVTHALLLCANSDHNDPPYAIVPRTDFSKESVFLRRLSHNGQNIQKHHLGFLFSKLIKKITYHNLRNTLSRSFPALLKLPNRWLHVPSAYLKSVFEDHLDVYFFSSVHLKGQPLTDAICAEINARIKYLENYRFFDAPEPLLEDKSEKKALVVNTSDFLIRNHFYHDEPLIDQKAIGIFKRILADNFSGKLIIRIDASSAIIDELFTAGEELGDFYANEAFATIEELYDIEPAITELHLMIDTHESCLQLPSLKNCKFSKNFKLVLPYDHNLIQQQFLMESVFQGKFSLTLPMTTKTLGPYFLSGAKFDEPMHFFSPASLKTVQREFCSSAKFSKGGVFWFSTGLKRIAESFFFRSEIKEEMTLKLPPTLTEIEDYFFSEAKFNAPFKLVLPDSLTTLNLRGFFESVENPDYITISAPQGLAKDAEAICRITGINFIVRK